MQMKQQTRAPKPPDKFRRLQPGEPVTGPAFLRTYDWKLLRYTALIRSSGQCECCGATPKTGAVLHVDHIKPRSRYPHLALDLNNLQVLCSQCNIGKSNTDETDHRRETPEQREARELLAEIHADLRLITQALETGPDQRHAQAAAKEGTA